jgi:hypothetical protein
MRSNLRRAGLVTLIVLSASMVARPPSVERPVERLRNGLPSRQALAGNTERTALQAMLLRYAARCALREDQEVDGPPSSSGQPQRFRGALGIAPEWQQGTCDLVCQQKVSSCLIALTNRTGKHVMLSLLSASPQMSDKLRPDQHDIGFPHQEGAFYGNVFSGEAFACRGRDVQKGAQVKRFCAREPASCSGIAQFADAGRCDEVCQMTCVGLSDGTERCAAASCRDPQGRLWPYPVTAYLRNKIEAGNADAIDGARPGDDQSVEGFADRGSARYQQVDFGDAPGGVRTFAAALTARAPGGRIELWLEGGPRLGVLDVKPTGGAEREQMVAIDARAVSGPHTVVLKFSHARAIGRLSTIELR